MRKSYKNKRDQYRAERDVFERENIRLKEEIGRKEAIKKRNLSCIAYCSNCQIVSRVTVPYGSTIHESGCAYCGVKNSGYLVSKVKSY